MKKYIYIAIASFLLPIGMKAQSVAIDFTQYKGSQITNSDFEDWSGPDFDNVPVGWHSFESVGGSNLFVAFAKSSDHTSKYTTNLHDGTTGQSCLRLVPRNLGLALANGTISTGRMNAGDFAPTSPKNHAQMDISVTETSNGTPFYAVLEKRPTAIAVWMKFTQGTPQAEHPYATISAALTTGQYYQEPTSDNDSSMVIGYAKNNKITTNEGQWQRIYVPFRYDSENFNKTKEPKAIMVTISTNADPGQGTANDELLVDDLELIYTQHVTINSTGYATMTNMSMLNHKVKIPEGITAYTIKSNAAGQPMIKDTYKAGQVLPYTAPVLLEGAPGEYDFATTLYEEPEYIKPEGDICIVGAAELNTPTDEYRFYRLTGNEGVAGFHEVFHGLKIRDIEALLRVKAKMGAKDYQHIYFRPEIEGDVNCDGEVSISDITYIANELLGTQEIKGQLLIPDTDLNEDGIVSIADISEAVNILLGKD